MCSLSFHLCLLLAVGLHGFMIVPFGKARRPPLSTPSAKSSSNVQASHLCATRNLCVPSWYVILLGSY